MLKYGVTPCMRTSEAVPAMKPLPSAAQEMVVLSPLKKVDGAERMQVPVRIKKFAEVMKMEGVTRLLIVT